MEQGEPSLGSAFPPPPPFYRFFSAENLRLLKSGAPSSLPPEKRAELQYLTVPPAPSEGVYSTYGEPWFLPDRLPSLGELGVTQLYPSEPTLNRTDELKNLAKSVLLNYLELVGIMGVDPAGWQTKVEDLRIIFINMHHLLNEYRPHQARETLCMMMEEEIERTKEEIRKVEEACEKVEEVLHKVVASAELAKEGGPDEGDMEDVVPAAVGGEEENHGNRKKEEKLWFEEEKLLKMWNG